jgi:hypothetical protein
LPSVGFGGGFFGFACRQLRLQCGYLRLQCSLILRPSRAASQKRKAQRHYSNINYIFHTNHPLRRPSLSMRRASAQPKPAGFQAKMPVPQGPFPAPAA